MNQTLCQKDIQLVPLHEGHGGFYLELANIPEINLRVNQPFPCTPKDFHTLLERSMQHENNFNWLIEQAGAPAGIINAAAKHHPAIYQGGYWIHPEYWGRGIATRALQLVQYFLFNERNAHRLQAVVEPDNASSIRVLEKCGYLREGLLKSYYPTRRRGLIDVYMYGCLNP